MAVSGGQIKGDARVRARVGIGMECSFTMCATYYLRCRFVSTGGEMGSLVSYGSLEFCQSCIEFENRTQNTHLTFMANR